MSNAQEFVNSFMDKLAGTATLTPALKNIFSTILAKQVKVVGSEVTFDPAFEQLAKIFTFISTQAADRPATPVSYDATQIADAKAAAGKETGLTVGGEAPDTPVDTSSLTAALGTLKAAQDDLATFLKDVDMDGDGEGDNATTAAVDANLTTQITTVETAIDGYKGTNTIVKGYGTADTFGGVSPAIQTTILTEVKAAMEAEVTKTTAEINKTTGLMNKANALADAETAYNSSVDVFAAAAKALKAESAKYDIENGGTAIAVVTDFSAITDATSLLTALTNSPFDVKNGQIAIKAGSETKIGVNALLSAANNVLNTMKAESTTKATLENSLLAVLEAENTKTAFDAEFRTNTVTITTAHTTANSTAKTYTLKIGTDTYSVSIAADAADADATAIAALLVAEINDATIATNSAGVITITGAFTSEITATEPTSDTDATAKAIDASDTSGSSSSKGVENYYAPLDITDVVAAAASEHDAKVDLAAQTLKAANVTAYIAAVEALEALNKAEVAYTEAKGFVSQKDAFEKAVEDADQVLEDEGYAVISDYSAATAEDDIFIFTENTGVANAKSIANFNLKGEDLIFLGTDYKVVNLGASDNLATGSFGDASVLEVFVKVSGSDTELYFEDSTKTFAGNSSSVEDLTQITLTGVTGDVSVVDGFLTIA